MYDTTYEYPVTNISNAVVALFSSLPAYASALVDQSTGSTVMAIVLPFVFFLLSKGVDVALKIYFDRRNEKRLNGTKNSSNNNRN